MLAHLGIKYNVQKTLQEKGRVSSKCPTCPPSLLRMDSRKAVPQKENPKGAHWAPGGGAPRGMSCFWTCPA